MRQGGLYLAVGDSTVWTGTTTGADLYTYRVWSAINAQYGKIKHLNKGLGGATSSEMVMNIKFLTMVEPDLVTIGVGMNDANADAVPVETYKSNLSRLIDAYRVQNPNVHIILCTPNRTNNAAMANIQIYRDGMAEVGLSENVSICRFENAFTDAEVTTYCGDSPAVHPNSAGHEKLFNVLWSVVQTGKWLNSIGK